MPTVKSIVREDVVVAAPTDSVGDLADSMNDERVGSVIVVEDERPVGVVTDRDLALKVLRQGRDPAETTAQEIMTEEVITVDEDAGIFDVISRMAEDGVRRIPAVDDAGALAGIVTFDDFIVLLGRELKHLGDVVEAESPPY
jgi:CBS domain-containing protein